MNDGSRYKKEDRDVQCSEEKGRPEQYLLGRAEKVTEL